MVYGSLFINVSLLITIKPETKHTLFAVNFFLSYIERHLTKSGYFSEVHFHTQLQNRATSKFRKTVVFVSLMVGN